MILVRTAVVLSPATRKFADNHITTSVPPHRSPIEPVLRWGLDIHYLDLLLFVSWPCLSWWMLSAGLVMVLVMLTNGSGVVELLTRTTLLEFLTDTRCARQRQFSFFTFFLFCFFPSP